MSLLDDPLDTTLGWTGSFGRRVNALSRWARWGWSTGWGIPPVLALVGMAANATTGGTDAQGGAITTRGAGEALLFIWAIGVFLCLTRLEGRRMDRQHRMWLAWVALVTVMELLPVAIVLWPNP